ncbi:MAG: SHOCT domain-containing protein [Theionarchaea archaeon]|nr:SHOCT domain-containing protein [Theionarchaea archaeon]
MLVIIVVVGIIVVVVVVIVIVKRRKPAVKEIPLEEEVLPPEGEEVLEPEKDPLQVLKDRYARGEITKEEYEDLKSVLEKG